MATNPAFTFALALAAGMVAQSAAHHLRMPGIVLLLLSGVLLGPDALNVIQPETLGHGLEMLVGLSVAVILFEGGLNLNVGRILREATTIRKLITLGALVTAVGGAVAAKVFMGWEWRVAILFGSLVMVTGPTVITPLLRRIRVNRNVHTILEAEGVLIDPIGAIVAVVALEMALSTSATSAAVGLLGLPGRLGLGAVLGAAGGLVIGLLLRYERFVPEGWESIFTLSLVLTLFELSDAILPESGIMAVVVAGLVVGNMRTRVQRELLEFKERLTVMLVGLLFVLLAADVRLAEVIGLGLGGLATVAALILVLRPLGVALSAHGSALSWREKGFIAWLGPRGIVAAAVASLFAQRLQEQGLEAGTELRALVFLVIAVTVVVQGLSGGFVAEILGVRRPRRNGYIIVGANAIGRALAHALKAGNEDVVLVDTNALEARAAEEEGLRVVFGNAHDEAPLIRADAESRRGFISATPNAGTNLLLARRARETFRVPRTYTALQRGRTGVQPKQVHEAGASILFGRPVDLEPWLHRLSQGTAVVRRWRYHGDDGAPVPTLDEQPPRRGTISVLPLTLTRGDRTMPVDERTSLHHGDVALFLCHGDADVLSARLEMEGWEELIQFELPDEGPAEGPAAGDGAGARAEGERRRRAKA